MLWVCVSVIVVRNIIMTGSVGPAYGVLRGLWSPSRPPVRPCSLELECGDGQQTFCMTGKPSAVSDGLYTRRYCTDEPTPGLTGLWPPFPGPETGGSSSWFILSVFSHWTEGDNLKRDWPLPPPGNKTPSKTGKRTVAPRSETMSLGKPWRRTTWDRTNSAVSLAEGSLGNATKCTILEKRSTMMSMTVLPSELGNPVTKSMAMLDQGHEKIGSGWSWPAGAWREGLQRAQMGHADTYSLTSLSFVLRWTPFWTERHTDELYCLWLTFGIGLLRRLRPRHPPPQWIEMQGPGAWGWEREWTVSSAIGRLDSPVGSSWKRLWSR